VTHPRKIEPGENTLVTRRTLDRWMLLRPTPKALRFMRYTLACTANEHGLLIAAHVGMMTHPHTLLVDPWGTRSDFFRDCHAFTARGLNLLHDREGYFWDDKQTSDVILESDQAILNAVLYIAENVLASNLV